MNEVILLLNLGTSFDGVLGIAAVGAKVILSAVFLFLVGKRQTKTGGGIRQRSEWRSICSGSGVGRFRVEGRVGLTCLLRLAFVSTRLLIEHLVEVDRLVNQGLDFCLASCDDDCFFYLVVKSAVKHNALRLVIDTEGYCEALERLGVRSRRACLNEAIESILTFQFIGTVAVDIGEGGHERSVVFAKRVPFVRDDFACP